MIVVVLLSGGMDSTACLLWAQEMEEAEIVPLFVDYGQMAADIEEQTARAVVREVLGDASALEVVRVALAGGITRADFDASDPVSCVVPGRNLVLLSLAASRAAQNPPGLVLLGACRDDAAAFADCRRDTLRAMESALNLAAMAVTIAAPFLEWTKRDIVKWSTELGRERILQMSVSCYRGTACGACHACRARAEGFEALL